MLPQSVRRVLARPMDSAVRRRLDLVPDPAHRLDVRRAVRVGLDLLAEGADVDVERPLVAVEVRPPDPIEDRAARNDPPDALGEHPEQVELARGEMDALAPDGRDARPRVEHQAADHYHILDGRTMDRLSGAP